MNFPTPLIPGYLIRRYKRFLAEIELEDGTLITAHCPNSGSMLNLTQPRSKVWVRFLPPSKTRSLSYAWEMVEVNGALVGINTHRANEIVAEALTLDRIPELLGYSNLRREVAYGNQCRIDFLLEDSDKPPCYVEVKNVTLKRVEAAEFPDAVTLRGSKHLQELARLVTSQTARAVLLYVVQRQDCSFFQIAQDIDPLYMRAAEAAQKAGVTALCYHCNLTPQSITLEKPLPYPL